MVSRLLSNTTPLCYMPDGRLVCYHRGRIIVLRDGVEIAEFTIPIKIVERFLGWNRYATRLLRFGVRTAIPIDNNTILLSIGHIIKELDFNKGVLSDGWYCGEGIRPLVFSIVKDINGVADGVYFGGYIRNKDKKPVGIYHRVGIDKWEIVYSFPQGAINHVHNIVADHCRQCLWAFTGDFDEASAVWKITDNFKSVECVVSNDQKYRACVVYVLPEGVLYATDTPFAPNHIYLLKEDYSLSIVRDIEGSCIYGCKWNDNYVFSTAVEPDGRNETTLRLLFGWKRGSGIKDNYAHIYYGNIKNGFTELYKEKKDVWPYIFQFGVFKFPYGLNEGNSLVFQPLATNKNDLNLMEITIN